MKLTTTTHSKADEKSNGLLKDLVLSMDHINYNLLPVNLLVPS